MPLLTRLALVLALCLSAAQSHAGAWPRDKGTWFASVAAQFSWPQDIATLQSVNPTSEYYMLYLEYGLTERLTLGLDLGRSERGTGKTIAFARLPVWARDRPLKLAVELGLGQIDGAPVVRPGFSIGRGIRLWDRDGWLSMESQAEIATDSGQADLKLDLTFGLTAQSGRKYLLQVQSGAPADRAAFARLAPSLVIPFGKARYIELGGTYGLTGDETFGVKLGLWQKF